MTTSIKINPLDFKGTGLQLSADANVVGHGMEGVAVEDRGTIVKFYFNRGGSMKNAGVSQAAVNAFQNECGTLALVQRYNTTGIQTPAPIEAFRFSSPASSGNISYAAALRMTKLEGTKPDTDRIDPKSKAAERLLYDMGYAIGLMHRMAAMVPVAELKEHRNFAQEFFAEADKSSVITPQETQTIRALHAEQEARNPQRHLVHIDLSPQNTFFNGGGVNAIMDWSTARIGPREHDSFCAVPVFSEKGMCERRQHAHTEEGYYAATGHNRDRDGLELTEMIKMGRRLMNIERESTMSPGNIRALFGTGFIKTVRWARAEQNHRHGALVAG